VSALEKSDNMNENDSIERHMLDLYIGLCKDILKSRELKKDEMIQILSSMDNLFKKK